MTVGVFREFFYNERLDFKNLDSDTIVIFDTNTLLNIYRYSNDTRNKLISAIKGIRSNVWMPYQVGLEFNLNRRNVISNIIREKEKRKNEIEIAINESVTPLKQSVRAVSLKSTDANSRKKEIIEFLEEKTTDLKNELQKKIDELYEMVDLSEDLASEIGLIFDGQIGECYTQEQLDTKLANAKERYDNKIPPGYKDANKGDEVTHYNGIKFEKKYGDLIVWHQILDEARDEAIKKVVLVTDDNKEDWWYESSGKTIGPRAELKNEMLREANADLYMLNANSFLNNIATNEDVKDLISTEVYVEDKEEKPVSLWSEITQPLNQNSYFLKPFRTTPKKEREFKIDYNVDYSIDKFEFDYRYFADIQILNREISMEEEKADNLAANLKSLMNKITLMDEDNPDKDAMEEYYLSLLREELEIKRKIAELKKRKEKRINERED